MFCCCWSGILLLGLSLSTTSAAIITPQNRWQKCSFKVHQNNYYVICQVIQKPSSSSCWLMEPQCEQQICSYPMPWDVNNVTNLPPFPKFLLQTFQSWSALSTFHKQTANCWVSWSNQSVQFSKKRSGTTPQKSRRIYPTTNTFLWFSINVTNYFHWCYPVEPVSQFVTLR